MTKRTRLLILTTLLWAGVGIAAGADEAGRKIYVDQCASCHGDQGQGVRDKYSDPLVGDRSLSSLTRYISKRMPDDKPGECTGERAEQVADYIFKAFYSTEAQLRRNPPRVQLSRLTIGQYRATIADLVGDFHGVSPRDDRHGIKVEYFDDGRGFNNAKRLIERIESTIQVAYEGKPPSEKITAQEYAIRWSGAVVAPETGDYDFILETTNGARLWVNDRDNPLIDVWVRSGDDARHLASIRLLAGRAYSLRLEVAKEKKEGKLTVSLKWKPPHQAEQLVPELMLNPGGGSQWLVLQTPFPPDDNILGYERGASVSKAWDDATTQAAFEVAGYVTSRLQRFCGVNPDGGDQADARKKVISFARRFAERAFRRPLTDEVAAFYVDKQLGGDTPLLAGLRKVILLVLKSPRFLYNGLENDPADPYVAASRMSYALWDSLPDAKLLEAARGGKLKDRDGIAREVERMIADPRTQSKVRSFYHRWLKVDELRGLAKEANRFPGFDDALISDLRVSLDLFLDAVTWSQASDYRQLLQSDTLYFNGRLAKFYGAMLPEDAPFQPVTLAGQPRAGVLTHPLLMAGFAYSATTSPIHRGVFVSRNLLGRRLRSPPDSIVPLSPDLAPDLTTRQRIGKQTKPPACMSCHDMINPLGFTMEHFDAVGRMRMDEDGRAIDDSGSYRRMDGEVASFKGVRDLGAFLASAGEAQGAFVERLFKDIVKQPILAYGSDERARLLRFFSEHDCNIRSLLAEIVTSATLAPASAQKAAQP